MYPFEIGICVHTQEEIDEVFKSIVKAHPDAKAIKGTNYSRIEFPMVHISFLLSGQSRGYKFDKIYYSDNATIQEKNEILYPMVCNRMEPISHLYKHFQN